MVDGSLVFGRIRIPPAQAEPMAIHPFNGLSCKQWALLSEVAKRCPLSVRSIRRLADLRRLSEEGLVTVAQMRVCATRLGMEALWYHNLH